MIKLWGHKIGFRDIEKQSEGEAKTKGTKETCRQVVRQANRSKARKSVA